MKKVLSILLVTAVCCTVFGAETVLELPPTTENPRNSEGDFVVLKDGTLLFAWSRFYEAGEKEHASWDNGGADIACRRSTDGGRTWSEKDEILVRNTVMNVMSVSFLRLKDGRIAMFYMEKKNAKAYQPVMRTSTDEAKTWSEPVSVLGGLPEGVYVLNNARVIQLKSGRILVPLAFHPFSETGRFVPAARLICMRSDDAGQTWQAGEAVDTFDAAGQRIVTQEPGVIELKDGRVMMWSRTTAGSQYAGFSSDGGVTWTAFGPTDLVGPCSPATIRRLKSGELLAIWNDQRGRPDYRGRRAPLSVAVSTDEGKSWPTSRTLDANPNGHFCYTAAIESGDAVLLAYCTKRGRNLDTTRLTRVPLSEILSGATKVNWDFPREGCCHEGLAFADGKTGVLVWGGGDTLKMTVGRGDLWDHRGGYEWTAEQNYTNIIAAVRTGDNERLKALFKNEVPANWGGRRYNPYMLPLGRIVVTVPGAEMKRGELDTSTGLGFVEFVLAGARSRVELAMSKASGTFGAKFAEGVGYSVKLIPAIEQPEVKKILVPRGFTAPAMRTDGFVWEIPDDKPVSLTCRTNANELMVSTARMSDPAPTAKDFASVRADALAYWTRFWQEGARVTVPDQELQEAFDYGMYKFGSMTDPDGIPAGLQGQWLEDDRLVPWNGDYHFNINVQECYSPAFRGGHFRNLMPLFRMVLSWRDRLRNNARQFAKIDDGYVLPHSVDDRGVCIGGFWTGTIDHASTAWVAALMYRYVRYSGDVAFLKEGAYDFMKGAMNVYLAMMEEKDGRLSIPLGPSPEWGDSDVRKAVGRDPSFQLAAAHRLARDLIDAAKRLDETPDARWLDVEKRLPAYTAGEGGFQLFEGQPFVSSHRHHSHMAGLYPFDTIALSEARDGAVAREAYRNWVFKGTGEWTGWCVPWASILHTHMGNAEAAVHALHSWKTFFNNPGHGSLHDAFCGGYTIFDGRRKIMQMDGQCAAATAILELMAHEIDGKVEFFKGCPVSWKDVSFENLALSDGTRVSGRRHEGVVTITKEK